MASVSVPRLSSEFGSGRGGWGPKGQIVRSDIPITNNAVDAVITTPAAQATAIAIQLTNDDGSAIAHAQDVEAWVFADAARAALATTGGSTGIAIGANGYIAQTRVSKKLFTCVTDATGLLKLTWTDNASEAAFLGVRLPSGRWVMSTALPIA
jgi:hypothetical protein